MKKILPYLCVSFMLTPFLAFAQPQNIEDAMLKSPLMAYHMCKNTALSHKERIMNPALKEYREESAKITNEAKNAFEKISWYVNTSYKKNSKRITDEKRDAMLGVTAKIASARKTALTTYHAEIALCEMNNPEVNKEKSASASTKSNTN